MASVVTHCIPAGSPWDPNQISRPGVNAVSTEVYNPIGLRRGRIIYFPSTTGPASQIVTNAPPASDQNTFLQNLLMDSWQVISVDEIGIEIPVCTPLGTKDWLAADVSNDAGHGARFLQTQLHYWDHINLWAKQNQGGAMPTIVVGFSWGAWAALQVAALRPTEIVGYLSRSAPTQWGGNPTAAICRNYSGVNFSGMDLQTMSEVAISSVSLSGTALTLNLATSTVGVISAGQCVAISGATGGSWANINGYWKVTSNTGTTLVVDFEGTAPTGAYTGSSASTRTNTFLNGVSTPGAVMFGSPAGDEDGAFINPNDLGAMAYTAVAAGQPVTAYSLPTETHQWSTIDSNILSANTYSATVTYLEGQWVYYSGNVYQALQTTTGNLPSGGAPNWSSGTAQTAAGWIQSTFTSTQYPPVY